VQQDADAIPPSATDATAPALHELVAVKVTGDRAGRQTSLNIKRNADVHADKPLAPAQLEQRYVVGAHLHRRGVDLLAHAAHVTNDHVGRRRQPGVALALLVQEAAVHARVWGGCNPPACRRHAHGR
jgi:hypothetical protein